jgi:hypothetical protein
LKLALKYPTVGTPRPTIELGADTGAQNETQPPKKKRKTMPFAQLLTDDACWQILKDAETETAKKAEETKQKKVLAVQKRVERESEKQKKRDEAMRKKEERARKKEEEEHTKKERRRARATNCHTIQGQRGEARPLTDLHEPSDKENIQPLMFLRG